MANSSPNSPAYQAAVRALNRVAVEESSKLCAVIEDPNATESERLDAIQALGSLIERLVLRLADLEEAALIRNENADRATASQEAA